MAENFFTPWVDNETVFTAASMNSPLQELDKAITYNRPAIVSCDGDVMWDATTDTLAWGGILRIVFNRSDGTAILNTVAAGSVTLADNQFAKVTLSEFNEAEVSVSVATASPGSASNFLSPQVMVLAYRNAVSDRLVSIGLGDLLVSTYSFAGLVTDLETEVSTARGIEESLDARLDAMDEDIALAASSGAVTSVAGKTGEVTLDPIDVGVGSFTCSIYAPGTCTAAQKLSKIIPTIACSIPAGLTGMLVAVDANPTSTEVISLNKNGVEFGTVTLATDGSFTLASTSGATFNGTSDYLEIFAPSVADATLSGVSINIAMLRG